MSKTLILALALLLSAAWLQAQSQYPQAGSSEQGASAPGQTAAQGCLQQTGGNYMLTDNAGTTYQLQGDSSKLSEHVGHEVQITGTTRSSSNATAPTAGMPTSATQQTLTVQNVKHISKTCKQASGK